MYKRKDLSMFEDDYIDEFKNQLPIINRDDEKYIFEDIKDYNKKYYMFQKYLHHNYDPSYDDILDYEKENICQNYLESIVWTTNYYFKDCLSWKWFYRYHYSPLLSDFNNYLQNIDNLDIIEYDNNPLKNKEQLLLVLPLQVYI